MARPIATRWRWPPESCARLAVEQRARGRGSSAALADAFASISALARFAQLAAPKRHVLAHRHVRVERVVLEHHGDVAVLRRHVVDHACRRSRSRRR